MEISDNILEALHQVLAQELFERISSGDATAAEFTAALNFLKASGVTFSSGAAVGKLTSALDDIDESELPANVRIMK